MRGPGRNVFLISANYPGPGGAGEAGIDTTHSLSRSGGNIQCLILTIFFYRILSLSKSPGHQDIKSLAKVYYEILYCSGLAVFTRDGGVLGCGGKSDDEWLMSAAPAPAQVGSGPALHIPPSVWVWLPTSLGANRGLSQSQQPPIPALWDLDQSENRIPEKKLTGCHWLLLTFMRASREKLWRRWKLCLTCLGTGRIHSILPLCIRWCHCKIRQNLQLMRKNQNHRSQSNCCLNVSPGKVTSKREQNLTQSFR